MFYVPYELFCDIQQTSAINVTKRMKIFPSVIPNDIRMFTSDPSWTRDVSVALM